MPSNLIEVHMELYQAHSDNEAGIYRLYTAVAEKLEDGPNDDEMAGCASPARSNIVWSRTRTRMYAFVEDLAVSQRSTSWCQRSLPSPMLLLHTPRLTADAGLVISGV